MTEWHNRSGFLGTLRSELDESDTGLHPDFETLAGLVGAVRSSYLSFKIRPEPAAELLQMLRLTSSDGREWTVGATSGLWYTRQADSHGWGQAPLPVGVEPGGKIRPEWLNEGIAKYLAAAEAAASSEPRANVNAGEQNIAINPFEHTDMREAPTVPRAVADKPRSAIAAEQDLDWLYEEWEGFDDQVAKMRTLRTAEKPQQDKLPAELPAELQADHNLSQHLDDVNGPAERVGSDVQGEAPAPRAINPEDFFFRPEE